MTKNLPAIRYELFVKAFEKKVTAAQAAIEALRAMEHPYNTVKDAMEAARLPNEQSMHMDPRSIGIQLHATLTDSLEALEALARSIGERLCAAGMHRDGEPATSHGGSMPCLWFAWQCQTERTGHFQVRIHMFVPSDGLRDCEFVKSERHTVEVEYAIRRKERPSHPAPANYEHRHASQNAIARSAEEDAP